MPRSTTEPRLPVLAGIGLGANLGDTRVTLNAAIDALKTLPDSMLRVVSSI